MMFFYGFALAEKGRNMDIKFLEKIKNENEKIILKHNGEVCSWSPFIDGNKKMRDLIPVKNRALIMNALVNIYFKAPVLLILKFNCEKDCTTSFHQVL
jgi:hypothetical protein